MADFPEWQHQFIAYRPYVGKDYGGGRFIRVEAGLHYLQGNSLPYFSVTGEIGRGGGRDCDTCGCIHEEIQGAWPQLTPVIALHLSDSNGAPMHAVANGWYQLAAYYGGAGERYHAGNSKGHHGGQYREPTPDESLAAFAEHVRISTEQARELAQQWACPDDWASSRRWYAQWIEAQRPRWQAEADAACLLLDKLTHVEAVTL